MLLENKFEKNSNFILVKYFCAFEFQNENIPAQAELAFGDPAQQIINWVREKGCDLVAMSTHGHRFLADVFLGATATRVRHSIDVPVLLLKAK